MGSYDNQDVFILDDLGPKTFIPPFTYHGFQYVELSGVESYRDIEDITALEVGCAIARAGEFTSSDQRLNKLVDIIDRAYRSNMTAGISTDCAARDERLPWLGDCFTDEVQSMCYLYDFSTFGINQTSVINDSLNSHGVCPPTLTRVSDEDASQVACWSDAGIVAPYLLWLNYGDQHSLETAYISSKRLIDHLYDNNPDGMPRTNYRVGWGD